MASHQHRTVRDGHDEERPVPQSTTSYTYDQLKTSRDLYGPEPHQESYMNGTPLQHNNLILNQATNEENEHIQHSPNTTSSQRFSIHDNHLDRQKDRNIMHGVDILANVTSVFEKPPSPIASFAETKAASSQIRSEDHKDLKRLDSGSNINVQYNNVSILEMIYPTTQQNHGIIDSVPERSTSASRGKKRKRNQGGSISNRALSSNGGRRRDRNTALSDEEQMLHYAVDTSKLVPQGLIDPIHQSLSFSFIQQTVADHVRNWIARSSFSSQFIQEVTILIAAYYPCSYPTILDEILVVFLFQRPEYIHELIKVLVEKFHKGGESVTLEKYPLLQVFAKHCGKNIHNYSTARHDVACITLLQNLLLLNTTVKLLLSPWIAGCLRVCSDSIVERIWSDIFMGLLRDQSNKKFDGKNGKKLNGTISTLKIPQPEHQISDIINIEQGWLTPSSTTNYCRFAPLLIQNVLSHNEYPTLLYSWWLDDALQYFFSTSCPLDVTTTILQKWMQIYLENNKDPEKDTAEKGYHHIMNLVLQIIATSKKRSSTCNVPFLIHILHFALATNSTGDNMELLSLESQKKLIEMVVQEYLPLVLGPISIHEKTFCLNVDSAHNSDSAINLKKGDKKVLQSTTTQQFFQTQMTTPFNPKPPTEDTTSIVTERLRLLYEALPNLPKCEVFLDILLLKWTRERFVLPWSYLYSFVVIALSNTTGEGITKFLEVVDDLCKYYFECVLGNSLGHLQSSGELLEKHQALLHLLLSDKVLENKLSWNLLKYVITSLHSISKVQVDKSNTAATLFQKVLLSRYLETGQTHTLTSLNNTRRSNSSTEDNVQLSRNESLTILSLLRLFCYFLNSTSGVGLFVRPQITSSTGIGSILVKQMTANINPSIHIKLLECIQLILSPSKDLESSITMINHLCAPHVVIAIVRRALDTSTQVASHAYELDLLQLLLPPNNKHSIAEKLLWVVIQYCVSTIAIQSIKIDELGDVVVCAIMHSSSHAKTTISNYLEMKLNDAIKNKWNIFVLNLIRKLLQVEYSVDSLLWNRLLSTALILLHDDCITSRMQHEIILVLQIFKSICNRIDDNETRTQKTLVGNKSVLQSTIVSVDLMEKMLETIVKLEKCVNNTSY